MSQSSHFNFEDEDEENFFEELAQDFSRAQMLGGFGQSQITDEGESSRLRRADLDFERDEAKEDEYDYLTPEGQSDEN